MGNGTADRTDPTDLGFYSFSENVGDGLALSVSSLPSASQAAELALYDDNGNLVAVADGNEPDGLSSTIDYTVPIGEGGTWYADVEPGGSSLTPFKYDLTIQGPTGFGPINPLPSVGVPEPQAWMLLIAGLAGIAGFRRGKNRTVRVAAPSPAA